jgi:hypothetical protein
LDLLSVTPTNTAKFKFIDPSNGGPATTDKGAEMFVCLFGAHTREFQAALLEKHRRTVGIFEKHSLKDGDKITGTAKEDMKESDIQMRCDITSSILVQINGKECKSKKTFYSNDAFDPWIVEIAKFADDTANFIKA